MQSIITKIAFLLVAFIATAAQAQKSQFYGGLDAVMPYGATWEVVNSPVEKLSVGTKIKPILGCTFNDRWAMEFGRFYVEATKGSVSESITIFPINLVYNTPLSEKTSFVFKGGGHHLEPSSATQVTTRRMAFWVCHWALASSIRFRNRLVW